MKEDGAISVLNEDFDVDKSLAYEYAWATIGTKQEQLMIYYREKNEEEAGLIKIVCVQGRWKCKNIRREVLNKKSVNDVMDLICTWSVNDVMSFLM